MTEKHPGATAYKDRHGVVRWRYRRRGKTVALPGDPAANTQFEAAYLAAVTGHPAPATLRRLPGAAHPRSLRAAWRLYTQTAHWHGKLKPSSRAQQIALAERFLATPIVEGEALRYGDMPVDQLKRRHIKQVLARYADTPHTAADILRLFRKITGVALDEEWIEQDPTFRLSYRPALIGFKAWPLEIREAFEARWPLGSTARTVYALALYQGHRRGDIARMRWRDIEAGAGHIVQQKTGAAVWIPLHDELVKALEAAPRRGDTIVVTQYGKPFSIKALGMRMQDWTRAADIPAGYTLHGLRKTLGKMLAEGGATTRQIMAVLGHSSIAHAELYTREAEQRTLARAGIRLLSRNKERQT
jgi:integrase